jgi:hypothetical protein
VEPLQGRVVIFSSGMENPHRVERVVWGQRYVLAFWFTCDEAREFEIFLDGNAHVEFSRNIKSQLQSRVSSSHQRNNDADNSKRRSRSDRSKRVRSAETEL